MAEFNFNDQHLESNDNLLLDKINQEFEDYLTETGVTDSLIKVIKMIYDMEEKPTDPLEFIRTHMTQIIPEKVELAKLQEKFANLAQQIIVLQEENDNMINRLKELKPNESKIKNNNTGINNDGSHIY